MLFLFWLINDSIEGQEYQQHEPNKLSKGVKRQQGK
jgi:hypothetical protein